MLMISIVIVVLLLLKKKEDTSEYYFYTKVDDASKNKVDLSVNVQKQTADRSIHELMLYDYHKIVNTKSTVLYMPARIQIVNNLIYVVDIQNNCVAAFNGEGLLVMRYGREGKGPGEFTYPGEIFVGSKDTIIASDKEQKRINCFYKDYIGKITPKAYQIRQICLNNGNVVALHDDNNYFGKIIELNNEGNVVKEYPPIITSDNVQKYSFGDILWGTLCRNNGSVIYVPTYFNIIIKYTNGQMSKAISTIDSLRTPVVNITKIAMPGGFGFRTTSVSDNNKRVNKNACIDNNILYVWSREGSASRGNIIIDKYDTETLGYKESYQIKINIKAAEIAISDKMFAFIDLNNEIHIYKYKMTN